MQCTCKLWREGMASKAARYSVRSSVTHDFISALCKQSNMRNGNQNRSVSLQYTISYLIVYTHAFTRKGYVLLVVNKTQ